MAEAVAVPCDRLTLVTHLRALGVDVPLEASVAFGRAIAALPHPDRVSLWWEACATLTSSPEHREALEAAFDWWWRGGLALPLGDPLGPPTDPEVVHAGEHDTDHHVGEPRSRHQRVTNRAPEERRQRCLMSTSSSTGAALPRSKS
ncbi:MAG: hypothetical protein N2037_02035 [Acidimicrobiales bacterium]|nr:hypothetical protein [Acidimicrobiales bacterium]